MPAASRRLVWTPRAGADLFHIYRHSRDQWGEAHADAYVSRLTAMLERASRRPSPGRPYTSTSGAVYRALLHSPYVVIAELHDDALRVLTIVHERRDLGGWLDTLLT
jgi:plasmid stabilization system protein ParE